MVAISTRKLNYSQILLGISSNPSTDPTLHNTAFEGYYEIPVLLTVLALNMKRSWNNAVLLHVDNCSCKAQGSHIRRNELP